MTNVNTDSLITRLFMFLEDANWFKAYEYAEKILDIDPENALAYLGRLMCSMNVRKQEQLADLYVPYDDNIDYQKVIRFGDESLVATLKGYLEQVKERYLNHIVCLLNSAQSENECLQIADMFLRIIDYKNSEGLRKSCFEKAELCRMDAIYMSAVKDAEQGSISGYNSAIEKFSGIRNWKDSEQQIKKCENNIKRRQKEIKRAIIISVAALFAIVVMIVIFILTGPLRKASAMEDQLVGMHENAFGGKYTFNSDNTFEYQYYEIKRYGTWEVDTDISLILEYDDGQCDVFLYNNGPCEDHWCEPQNGEFYLDGIEYHTGGWKVW